MRMLIIIMLLAVVQSAIGQRKKSNVVILTIDKDSLEYDKSRKSLLVPYTFRNGSTETVVFGFPGVPEAVPFDLKEMCEKKAIGAGVAFAIFDASGTQKRYMMEIHTDVSKREVTRSELDSVFKISHARFIGSRKHLSKNDTIYSCTEVMVADFRLKPGLYYFQLTYYSGERIVNVIGKEEFTRLQSKLFQGCVMSKKIPFVVH